MDTPNINSNAQGGTSRPLAGSKRPQGDLVCPWCGCTEHYQAGRVHRCSRCYRVRWMDMPVEPEAAPRPGASALGPPAPESKAGEQREPALRAGTRLMVVRAAAVILVIVSVLPCYIDLGVDSATRAKLTWIAAVAATWLVSLVAEGGPNHH
jgi:hypothetical protein